MGSGSVVVCSTYILDDTAPDSPRLPNKRDSLSESGVGLATPTRERESARVLCLFQLQISLPRNSVCIPFRSGELSWLQLTCAACSVIWLNEPLLGDALLRATATTPFCTRTQSNANVWTGLNVLSFINSSLPLGARDFFFHFWCSVCITQTPVLTKHMHLYYISPSKSFLATS